MATGAEIVRCIMQGIRVLAVDPLGDYRRLTAELGGLYIEPGSGEAGLNPLALTGERGRERAHRQAPNSRVARLGYGRKPFAG